MFCVCCAQVVDTPGLFDTTLDKEAVMKEITKCFGIVSPGPHAIVLVMRIGVKYTAEENRAVEEVHEIFGAQLLRFLVIAFTHGDKLEQAGEAEREAALKEMLDSAPDKLKALLNVSRCRFLFCLLVHVHAHRGDSRQILNMLTHW